MTTKIWTKPQTQKLIRALRKEGYTVSKSPSGAYACYIFGNRVFTALPGSCGTYLVTYDDRLIQEAA